MENELLKKLMNSKFAECKLIAQTEDEARGRIIKVYKIQDRLDIIGLHDVFI
jgi:hypothetical protein